MKIKGKYLKALAGALLLSGLLTVSVSAAGSSQTATDDAPLKMDKSTSSSESSSGASSSKSGEGTWAIYLYVCGSNLESVNGLATENLSALANAKRSEDTVIVAQTGGACQWKNELVDPDKSQRWLFHEDKLRLVDEQDQADMGESETFADFLTYASTNYPADHTMVIMWDHGGGTLYGCCSDENYNDPLSLQEMHDAFSEVYDLSSSKPPIDILGFDCCLMATVDAADTFQDTARYMVASEESEPGDGWNYGEIGSALGKDPSMDAEKLGKLICDSYYEGLQKIDKKNNWNEACTATLSLTDLSKVSELCEAFSDYTDEMVKTAYENPIYYKYYSEYADVAENYGGNNRAEGYYDLTDIKGFVECSDDTTPSSTRVLKALEDCVIYDVNGEYRSGSGGLSFYFDYDGSDAKNEIYLENGTFEGLKVLYSMGVSGQLDSEQSKYLQDLGLDPDNLPTVTTFAGSDFDGKPIEFSEDGTAYTDFGDDAVKCATDSMCYYYIIQDGETYLLGSDSDVKSDLEESGVVTSQMDSDWGYLDGHLIHMDLVYDTDYYNIYSVPIQVDGTNLCLQVIYDFTDKEWYTLGARKPGEATILTDPDKTIYLEEGTEITLLQYKLGDDGSIIPVEGATFQYEGDDSFQYGALGDGQYAMKLAVQDMYAHVACSDFAVYDLKDGNATFDTSGSFEIPTTSVTTVTAGQMAQDGNWHKANLNVINNTKYDIEELYVATAAADSWGSNALTTPIKAGEDTADRGFTMTYDSDEMIWEIKVVDSEGKAHSFDWDLTYCSSTDMTVTFTLDEDGSWMIDPE